MKRLIYLLAFVLFPVMVWAQGSIWDVPFEERDSVWEARRDSIGRIYGDTYDGLINVGCIGDVFTGYDIMPDTVGVPAYLRDGEKRTSRYKFYHVDPLKQKVRQIVVLRAKWDNFPANAMDPDGGNKLAAVTPKEYLELSRQDAIWGEVWEVCFPSKYPHPKDTIISYPGYEFVCVEKGYEHLDLITHNYYQQEDWDALKTTDFLEHSKELVSFVDTVAGKPKEYVCMARNYSLGYADYTKERSYLHTLSRWMIGPKNKDDYWLRKWLDHIKQQQLLKQQRQPLWDGSLLTKYNIKYKQI